ncbi:MAG: alanine dehydrogenase [Nitrospirae bacterium]|nr:alanine dehydrogenase [Nitrospirota bacterium]
MIIGIPKEIKKEEFRVAVTPSGVRELRKAGHAVLVETGAGAGSDFSDSEYLRENAEVLDRKILFDRADLIVKVKEPLPSEYDLLTEGQALFTYLHLAPNRELTDLLLQKKIAAFGYETLEKDQAFPLLIPMSEVAGRMAPLMGAFFLQKFHGGTGLLPSGMEGVRPAKAVILGAGVVGTNAARIAAGIGMDVIVLNRGIERLQRIDELFMGRVKTLSLTGANILLEIKDADIIIGAVLVPGGKTPLLITRDMLKTMKKGAVIVDVAIDQGGCAETSRPSTHDNPVYEVDGILHYSVANMPGAYPRTSTLALTNATLPYIKIIADMGIDKASDDPVIKTALNTYNGKIVHPTLAAAMDGNKKG